MRAGLAGISRAALAQQTGLSSAELEAALAGGEKRGEIASIGDGCYAASAAVAEAERRLLGALGEFHAANPIKPGMPKGALRGALPDNAPLALFERALAALAGRGEIALAEDLVRSAAFAPRLSAREEVLAMRVRESARDARLEPRTLREMESALAADAAMLREVLAHLERAGALVRAPGDLWFDARVVAELRARLVAHLEAHGEIGTAAYKDLIGTTRKFAMPLMELFDTEQLTVRRGEVRVLKRKPK